MPSLPYLLVDKTGNVKNNQISLTDLIDFAALKAPNMPSLFVQRANSSGGRGNFIVRYSLQTGNYLWPDNITTDLNATLTRIKEIALTNNDQVRVSPFVDLRDTFSIGVSVKSKDRVFFLGPREQLIDDKNTFVGFSYRQSQEPEASEMAHQLVRCLLDKMPDFIGNFGIDFARFYNPHTDREELFIAEINMRLDGTLPLSRIILRYNSQAWLKGDLHIAQLDSVPTSVLCHKQLLSRLRAALPVYSPDSQYGLIALTPAIQDLTKRRKTVPAYVSLGVVSSSQEESKELLRKAASIL